MMNGLERTTVNPLVMSGKPCIRGLRVTVANVLRLLAAGHTPQRLLAAYPYYSDSIAPVLSEDQI